MSYQIKSTPFFQRMLTTSKVNGQLQMLKEEFERMNFFDDRNIERKMREVRLKRLFKEIEKIKELNSEKQKLDYRVKPRTRESERLENLRKAKRLGQYYSQQNFKNVVTSDVTLEEKRKNMSQSKLKSETILKRRIKYGNEISDWNLQNIKLKNIRKELGQETIKKHTKEKETDMKEQSPRNKQSVDCKNQCSPKETPIPKECDGNTSFINLSKNVQLIDVEKIDENLFKNCNELHETILIDKDNIQLTLSCSSGKNTQTRRGIKLWRKLFVLLKRQNQMAHKLESLQFLNNRNPEKNIPDYQLRSISNDTNLTQSDIIPSRMDQFNQKLIEQDEECNSERFINSEYFFDAFTTKSLDDEEPRYPPPPPPPPPISLPILSHKTCPFQLSLRSSETNVLSNSVDVKKEIFKSKVEVLKSVFEHQSK